MNSFMQWLKNLPGIFSRVKSTGLDKAANPGQAATKMYNSKVISQVRNRNISGNQFMKGEGKHATRLSAAHLGKLVAFFYDAKTKDKLPYWDRFPLVVPIELYKDGFLGLNLHYLPPKYRAVLLDQILQITENHPSAKSIRLTYGILQSLSRTKLYVPCVKRYLYTPYMKSSFYILPRETWVVSIFLPLERFQGANKRRVYNESIRKSR